MIEASFDISCLTRRGVPIQHFDAGEKIFLEEDAGDCMYVVQSGNVDVITFGSVLESVGPGGIFGRRRTAQCRSFGERGHRDCRDRQGYVCPTRS